MNAGHEKERNGVSLGNNHKNRKGKSEPECRTVFTLGSPPKNQKIYLSLLSSAYAPVIWLKIVVCRDD